MHRRLRRRGQPGARGRRLRRHARSGRARLRCRARGDGTAGLSSGDDAQDLRLRLSQPGAVIASARARMRAQPRADLADRPACSRTSRRSPTSAATTVQPSARCASSSSRSAATSISWTPASSRSTAASSKPSTPRRRASRARSCERRLGEIDAAIARYLAELDRADEVVSKTGMSCPRTRGSRAIKKLAHYRKESRRSGPSSSAWTAPAKRRSR